MHVPKWGKYLILCIRFANLSENKIKKKWTQYILNTAAMQIYLLFLKLYRAISNFEKGFAELSYIANFKEIFEMESMTALQMIK